MYPGGIEMTKDTAISLGFCLGATTISMVELEKRDGKISVVNALSRPHLGNIRGCFTTLLTEQHDIDRKKICATGRKFRNSLQLASIAEPEAVEYATAHILPKNHPYRLIISAGGETFLVYHLDDHGGIQNIHTGNKCASGTGEFFLQQLRRMNIALDVAAALEPPSKVLKVSGRCSVFCKSDCTHALNKGVDKGSVVAGLSSMMADKVLELCQTIHGDHALLVGGCSANRSMVHFLRQKVDNLLIPEEAPYFEALGAALWAFDHPVLPFPGVDELFRDNDCRFSFHQPLEHFRHLVRYENRPHSSAEPGDHTILGLDVGSTTTKGIILRRRDKAILASVYLRTNGDPIRASREVYRALYDQLQSPVIIEALGVTGSGRQIAGLHAQTPGIINEIIAHATAASFFDPAVDTIFEIGGQDAKYTFLTNGVPSDYAMNEACSAGTGSFLEEAAHESLGIDVTKIGELAMLGSRPPNFNDQCAAFIGSDIKSAGQLHIPTEDIIAGLIYSVSMNFINRVKGNRPVGKKIFVQGGVCYNRAVPTAIAALTGKEVIVPPDPGLMGAFGVALEVEKRMEGGLIKSRVFDLPSIAARQVSYGKPFVCRGGGDGCDRKCEIARVILDGTEFPFGGICNRFDIQQSQRKIKAADYDFVEARQRLIFSSRLSAESLPVATTTGHDCMPTVRMNASFFTHTYYPFFHHFFKEIGYHLQLPLEISPQGMTRCGAPFCYPVEIAHGYAATMLDTEADFTFLPHIKGFPAGSSGDTSCTCIFVQSEPFYLKSAFPALDAPTTLSPTIDFSDDPKTLRKTFVDLGRQLGAGNKKSRQAFAAASAAQERCFSELKRMGRQALDDLEKNPNEIAVVLFGRPYNSFTREANKGISLKLAAKGIKVIPFDMLPLAAEVVDEESNMFWAMGTLLLKAARFVARHPQLFATYITNFSCGPDSFIITYFRDIMGSKPSLTLELDSHTADAGLETRLEAFLDIVNSATAHKSPAAYSTVAENSPGDEIITGSEGSTICTSSGQHVQLTDRRVRLLVPSMGKYSSPLLECAFAKAGIRATSLAPATAETLKLGRANSSCKECLPLQTTIGTLLHYLQNERPEDEISIYFMPSAPGPCRFGQYNVYAKRLLSLYKFPDVAVFSPNSKNCYGGLGTDFSLTAWRAIVIGDLFNEMWSTILTAAHSPEDAQLLLDDNYEAIRRILDSNWSTLAKQLKKTARELATITLKAPYEDIPKISLVGEIYVRHDPISLQNLVERMASRGFIVRTAENSEWFKYLDWLISNDILGQKTLGFHFINWAKKRTDTKIRQLLAPAGLFYHGDMQVKHVVDLGANYISPQLRGEAILTVGTAFHDILSPSCGVISIGPFGCMPSRVAEAVLSQKFNTREKRKSLNGRIVSPLLKPGNRHLPFLAIETDGSPFPQIIEARLEAFCLQAERLHREMLAAGKTDT